jgi:hypothetical protein
LSTSTLIQPRRAHANELATLGFPDQFAGLKVASRFSKSSRSQGLHEGCDDPRADSPALVLKEFHGNREPAPDKVPPFGPCPNPERSALQIFTGTAGEDAPAELAAGVGGGEEDLASNTRSISSMQQLQALLNSLSPPTNFLSPLL